MTDKDVFVSFLTLFEAYKLPDLYPVTAETEEIPIFPKCVFVISSNSSQQGMIFFLFVGTLSV